MLVSSLRFRHFAVGTIALLVGACGGDPGTGPGTGPGTDPGSNPVAATLAITAGDQQTASARANTAFPTPLAVRVLTSTGAHVPNQAVTWAVPAEGGTIAPATSNTNTDGVATAVWTPSTKAGAYTATATVASATPVVFHGTVTSGAVASLTFDASFPTTAVVTTTVSVPVRVLDAFDNPVSGAIVHFATPTGRAVPAPAQATTDVAGKTRTIWTLGTVAEFNRLVVTIDGSGTTKTLDISSTAGVPAKLSYDNSYNATEVVGTTLQVPVHVRDQFDNPVANAPVTFDLLQGPGSSLGGQGTLTTDAAGQASNTWKVGTLVGPNELKISSPGTVSPANLLITATPAAPATIRKVAGDAQDAVIGDPVAIPPSVRVVDQFGNAVAGVAVRFTAAGGGIVTGGPTGNVPAIIITIPTDASGLATVASWKMGITPVANTLSVDVTGLTTVVFTATALLPPNNP
jgi:hypothetical protein